MLGQEEPPDLTELQYRAEIEKKVQDEYAQAEEVQTLQDRDRRSLALVISVTLVVGVILPLAGLIIGLTVRAFLWAAGF